MKASILARHESCLMDRTARVDLPRTIFQMAAASTKVMAGRFCADRLTAPQFAGASTPVGHTEEIANAHYRQVLPAHFERAITTEIVMPKVMPHDPVLSRTESQSPTDQISHFTSVQEKTAACECMQPCTLEAGGIEPPSCRPLITTSTRVFR